MTPEGSVPIEEFKEGDQLLSRSELAPDGPLRTRRVLQVFESFAELVNLHVAGRIVRTTIGHPFYVKDKGWVEAGNLRIGDPLQSHTGEWIVCEGVAPGGEYEKVYNLLIEDDHTYFAGETEWGFSVWAHNGCHLNFNHAVSQFGVYVISVGGKLYKVGKADMLRTGGPLGLPMRLHQQLRRLGRIHGHENVEGRIIQDLGQTTTGQAKVVESSILQFIYDTSGILLEGNIGFHPR